MRFSRTDAGMRTAPGIKLLQKSEQKAAHKAPPDFVKYY
jgi:hypothetical protein